MEQAAAARVGAAKVVTRSSMAVAAALRVEVGAGARAETGVSVEAAVVIG